MSENSGRGSDPAAARPEPHAGAAATRQLFALCSTDGEKAPRKGSGHADDTAVKDSRGAVETRAELAAQPTAYETADPRRRASSRQCAWRWLRKAGRRNRKAELHVCQRPRETRRWGLGAPVVQR